VRRVRIKDPLARRCLVITARTLELAVSTQLSRTSNKPGDFSATPRVGHLTESTSKYIVCRYIGLRYMSPTSTEFHVLLALMPGPRHGYGLMQDVAELSGGKLQIGPGTLYTAIKRLRDSGLIIECEGGADASRRRCYQLTRKGKSVASEEAQRLNDLVRVARKRGLLSTT
jgi:DNA-binding PadR family transcriptional regulator